MARENRFGEIYQTEVGEVQAEQPEIGGEEMSTEAGSYVMAREATAELGVPDLSTSSSAEEIEKREGIITGQKKQMPNEDSIKNERARANALMDSRCLDFLSLFSEKEQISVNELSEYIEINDDWLKIALLIRADYLQGLDSTLRITSEGATDFKRLSSIRELSEQES